jgi:hypothetical protein
LMYCSRQNISLVLERLRTQLDLNASRIIRECRGAVRGNVDWQATYIRRYGVSSDASLFVVREQNREFDTKPNRMLKFISKFILSLLEEFDRIVPGDTESEWVKNIKSMERNLKHILSSQYLKYVADVRYLTHDLVTSGLKHRNPLYRQMAKISQLYYNIYTKKDPKAVFDVIKNQLLVPKATDKLFEILALFNCIKCAEELRMEIGGKRDLSLLRSKYTNVITFNYDNGIVINIFYQHTPQSLSGKSRYFKTMESYGFNPKTLTPDIVIECIRDDMLIASFLEVKYSDDVSYVGIGLQSLYAYLYDFSEAWVEGSKALLVIKPTISSSPKEEGDSRVWIVDKAGMIDKIRVLF